MTTRTYFSGCIALPVALCVLGMSLDPRVFKPVLIVGCVVYLPPAIYAWWRIRRTTQMGALTSLSASFPFVSSLLLGGVFAFPRVVGGGNGDFMVAVVGWIVAMIVGYSYVIAIWLIYVLLNKVGLVKNEFAA